MHCQNSRKSWRNLRHEREFQYLRPTTPIMLGLLVILQSNSCYKSCVAAFVRGLLNAGLQSQPLTSSCISVSQRINTPWRNGIKTASIHSYTRTLHGVARYQQQERRLLWQQTTTDKKNSRRGKRRAAAAGRLRCSDDEVTMYLPRRVDCRRRTCEHAHRGPITRLPSRSAVAA